VIEVMTTRGMKNMLRKRVKFYSNRHRSWKKTKKKKQRRERIRKLDIVY